MPRRQRGGWGRNREMGWGTPTVYFPLLLFGFFVLDRTTRTAPAERERTGATPPFLPLARHGNGGGWHPVGHRVGHTTPAVGGWSLPSVCIPAGRLPGPRAGRTISHTERPDA